MSSTILTLQTKHIKHILSYYTKIDGLSDLYILPYAGKYWYVLKSKWQNPIVLAEYTGETYIKEDKTFTLILDTKQLLKDLDILSKDELKEPAYKDLEKKNLPKDFYVDVQISDDATKLSKIKHNKYVKSIGGEFFSLEKFMKQFDAQFYPKQFTLFNGYIDEASEFLNTPALGYIPITNKDETTFLWINTEENANRKFVIIPKDENTDNDKMKVKLEF